MGVFPLAGVPVVLLPWGGPPERTLCACRPARSCRTGGGTARSGATVAAAGARSEWRLSSSPGYFARTVGCHAANVSIEGEWR